MKTTIYKADFELGCVRQVEAAKPLGLDPNIPVMSGGLVKVLPVRGATHIFFCTESAAAAAVHERLLREIALHEQAIYTAQEAIRRLKQRNGLTEAPTSVGRFPPSDNDPFATAIAGAQS